jgi:hypothetical protein
MIGFPHGNGEDVAFAVVALFAPAARDDLLEFLVEITAAGERRGSVMVRVCPIRGVSLLCDTETRIDPFGGTAD